MKRRLLNSLTLLSLLLGVIALVLWVRSRSRTDTFMIRTAPSYLGRPNLKWVVIRTQDDWQISFQEKTVPHVDGGSPPWRDDVPLSFKHLTSPTGRSRKLTDAEQATFEADVDWAYRATPRLRWRSVARKPTSRAPRQTWARLGIRDYGNAWWIEDARFPGAFRESRIGVPYPTVAGLAAILPAVRAALWFRGYLARRRVGLCPACGYDLRQTTDRCPECGRGVTDDEARRAGWARENDADRPMTTTRPGRWLTALRRRWEVVAFVATVIAVGLALFRARGEGAGAPAAEVRSLRIELNAQVADVEREITRLREAGDAERAGRLEAELRRVQAPPSASAPIQTDAAELSVVGLYQGAHPRGARGASGSPPAGAAAVELRSTGRPVVLALCAYEPVTWELHLAPGARLQKVLLGGYYDQQVVGVPADVPVEKHTHAWNSPYFLAYRRNDRSYRQMARAVQKLTGLQVATFHGRYAYDGKPLVIGPGDFEWDVQQTLVALDPLHQAAIASARERALKDARTVGVQALWRQKPRLNPFKLSSSVACFDLTGPIEDTIRPIKGGLGQIAVDPAGQVAYGTDIHSLVRLDFTAEPVVPAVVNPRPPGFGWCSGVAFDTRRRRLMVISYSAFSTTSTLYLYAPDSGQWSAGVTVPTRNVFAPAYSAEEDCFYALGVSRNEDTATIVRFTPECQPEWQIPLTEPLPNLRYPGLMLSVQPVPVGRLLGLIAAAGEPGTPDAGEPARLVLIDPKSNRVLYRGVLAPHAGPPPATAPAEPG